MVCFGLENLEDPKIFTKKDLKEINTIREIEKLIPEFELKGKTKAQQEEDARIKREADEALEKAKSESEIVKVEEEKIEKIDSMEEAEEELK